MKNKDIISQYDLRKKFVVGYIGTHGLSHALEHIILAAELAAKEPDLKDVLFILIGDGSEKYKLIKMLKTLDQFFSSKEDSYKCKRRKKI